MFDEDFNVELTVAEFRQAVTVGDLYNMLENKDMAFLQISHVEIKGISACVPKRIERNRDYPYLSAEEIEKYIATIGVEQRHCAIHDGSICTSDLCFESAEKLLNELQWNRDEVGLLVFISHTADYKLPSTACILQDRLGLSKQCMAFDSPLGCSGFVYGLGIASSILQTGMIKKPCFWSVIPSHFMQVLRIRVLRCFSVMGALLLHWNIIRIMIVRWIFIFIVMARGGMH